MNPRLLRSIAATALRGQNPLVRRAVLDYGLPLVTKAIASRNPKAPASLAKASPRDLWPAFADYVRGQTWGHWIIVGARGTGKTALTLRLVQELSRPTFGIGLPALETVTPITPERMPAIPDGSVVAIDDTSLFFNQRGYDKWASQAMHAIVDIARHRDLVLIANVQHSRRIDKYLLDPTILFLKPPSLLHRHQEREGLAELVEDAKAAFARHAPSAWPRYVYVVTDRFEGLLPVPLPDGWSAKLSRNKATEVHPCRPD